MKKTSFVVLLAICLATVFNSCKTKKDDPKPIETETPPAKPSITPLLINKPWKMEKYVISPTISYEINKQIISVTDFFLATGQGFFVCATDDVFEFKATDSTAVSGTYTQSVFLDCNNEKNQGGTWAYNSNQTQIIMTAGDGSKTIFNVANITATSLDVTYTSKNPLSISDTKDYTSTVVFTPYTAVDSKAPLLTNKEWKITACVIEPTLVVELGGIKLPVSDLFAPMLQPYTACATDDIFEFKAITSNALSGAFSRKSNVKCSDEVDQVGTWTFDRDQTAIVASSNGGSTTYFMIKELTATEMKVAFSMMNPIDDKDTKIYTANTTLEPK